MNNLNLHSIISRDKNYSLEKATDIQIHLRNPCSLLWTTSMRWLVTEVGHMNSHERKEINQKMPSHPPDQAKADQSQPSAKHDS